jgi:hypothetical protein
MMVKYFDVDGNELVEPDLTDAQLVTRTYEIIPSEPAEYEKRTITIPSGTVISCKVKVKDYVPAETVITEYTVIPIEEKPESSNDVADNTEDTLLGGN